MLTLIEVLVLFALDLAVALTVGFWWIGRRERRRRAGMVDLIGMYAKPPHHSQPDPGIGSDVTR